MRSLHSIVILLIGIALALTFLFSARSNLSADPASAGVVHDAAPTAYSGYLNRDHETTAGVFEGTGADQCADAMVIPITVGPPREPVPIVILGDNTPATGPDCDSLLDGAPMWWEAFEIDREAHVRLSFCGTTPAHLPGTRELITACPESGTTCGEAVRSFRANDGFPLCDDDNWWAMFQYLAPGVYYYPVLSDEERLENGRGPYEITIEATEPSVHCDDDCDGPDVVTGHVAIFADTFGGLLQLGREGSIGVGTTGLGVDTTACNKGDAAARWLELPNTEHPVMTGNVYRFATIENSSRFEQIGHAWVKHGFGSGNGDECGFWCECPRDGCSFEMVEVGCSDSYAADQFEPCGSGLMGPRSAIHPYTGVMPEGGNLGPGGGCRENFPAANHIGHDHAKFPDPGISHRIQVRDVDLMPELNAGARYFVEGQYVVPSEYTDGNGNQNNNVSYRECAVEGPDEEGVFTFPMLSDTFAEQPAIRAWPGASYSRIEPAPMSDGIATLAYQVTDLGGGSWHYEYILYNQNMDRSVGAFTVPVPDSVTVSNVGFHAPLNHAPELNAENYPNDPWVVTRGDDAVRWSIEPFGVEPLGNAVRWGTAYNFRFDADSPPMSVNAEVGLFKSGETISVATLAPQPLGDQDCNNNGIEDTCDLDCNAPNCDVSGCGQSTDCDLTGVPDECEIDCNGNGIADSCDVRDGADTDCNANGVPDACEPDCDDNGIPDHCDISNGDLVDSRGNGIPDICDCPSLAAPLAESVVIAKNRYLTFVPGSPEELTAIRVTLSDIAGFESFSGQTRWVGPPQTYTDEGLGSFTAATLQCEPHFQDWGAIDELHIFGAEIVPNSAYAIQMTHDACTGSFDDASRYSAGLDVMTGAWGDVVEPFAGGGSAQPDFTDIASLVDKFQSLVTAPSKTWAQLQPNSVRPSFPIDFSDIAADIDAFTGQPYPYDGPEACP